MAGSSGHGFGVGIRLVPLLKGAGLTKIVAGLAILGLAAVIVFAIANHPRQLDIAASPDESLLLDMDELVHAAECAFLINGSAPASKGEVANTLAQGMMPFGYNACTGLNVVMHAPMPGQTGSEMVRAITQRLANLSHLRPDLTRIDDRQIRLCGNFDNQSDGQRNIAVAYDTIVALDTPVLTGPHAAGNVCFTVDVGLPYAFEELRDASRLATMDAIAGAAECALSEGELPVSLREIADIILDLGRGPDMRRCDVRNIHLAATTTTDISFRRLGPASIELCTSFETMGETSAALQADFDVQDRVHFAELMAPRPAPGPHCYAIALTADPEDDREPAWDEPIDLESLPVELRGDADKDRRAIGDVVNLLRLARCARLIGGTTAESFEAAIAAIDARSGLAQRHGCDWAADHFGNADTAPVASYGRIDDTRVRVCAEFARAWAQPLQLDYSGRATLEWPGNLPALNQPVEPGERCYEADISS